ncbi:putative quinol monooxygenase [Rhodococcus kronopolitis]|uniref:Quinol monooxygenase n=1 Tax=Rhodococcus kronopolitis TaxID=1460226 RepID=A0ABV9FJB1_9NOCA
MIIVAGALHVDPAGRENYLTGCVEAVRQARASDGCRDFALSPDLLDAGRINVFECWDSEAHLQRFRGSGPSEDQQHAIRSADVREYHVGG